MEETFYVKVVGIEPNKQCDLYPNESIHRVRVNAKGLLQPIRKNYDIIPTEYPVIRLSEKPHTKDCKECKNIFEIDTEFVKVDKDSTCIRCYERKYLPNGDGYRKALFASLKQNDLIYQKINIQNYLTPEKTNQIQNLLKTN